MRLAVREEVVDQHADDGEQEDEEGPEDFVRDGAVGLDDLDYTTLLATHPTISGREEREDMEDEDVDVPQAMMSRIKTTKPITPPPMPPPTFPPWAETGAAETRASWRRRVRNSWSMLAVGGRVIAV